MAGYLVVGVLDLGRDEEDGLEGDLALRHEVRLGHRNVGALLPDQLPVELVVLLLLDLSRPGDGVRV